jgi:hypothetical protein
MKKINELKDINNNAKIDALTDEERYQWYLRIKESVPLLKKTRDTADIEAAIRDYENKNGIV